MWSFISRIVLRLAAIRWLFKLGGLGLLVPIAFILKTIGLPVLLILMVIGLPVLALLFLFGLPVFMVLMVGGVFMGIVGAVLAVGMMALKFAIFVVLPIWLLFKLMGWAFRGFRCRPRNRGGDDETGGSADTTSRPTDVPPSDASASGPDTTVDPLVDPLD